jgi:hypothetical protein
MAFVNNQLHSATADNLEQLLLHISPADLAKLIANIEPCAVTGRITRSQVVIAMGEFGDIWPEGIRDRCESAEVIQFWR